MTDDLWDKDTANSIRGAAYQPTAPEISMLIHAATLQGWTVMFTDQHALLQPVSKTGTVILNRRPGMDPSTVIRAALQAMIDFGYQP